MVDVEHTKTGKFPDGAWQQRKVVDQTNVDFVSGERRSQSAFVRLPVNHRNTVALKSSNGVGVVVAGNDNDAHAKSPLQQDLDKVHSVSVFNKNRKV